MKMLSAAGYYSIASDFYVPAFTDTKWTLVGRANSALKEIELGFFGQEGLGRTTWRTCMK